MSTSANLYRVGAALVDKDTSAYRAAIERQAMMAKREARIVALEQSLGSVTSELSEIKEMLKCLLTAANS